MYTYCYIHSYITGIQSNYAAYNLFFCLVTFSHSHNATLKKKKKLALERNKAMWNIQNIYKHICAILFY